MKSIARSRGASPIVAYTARSTAMQVDASRLTIKPMKERRREDPAPSGINYEFRWPRVRRRSCLQRRQTRMSVTIALCRRRWSTAEQVDAPEVAYQPRGVEGGRLQCRSTHPNATPEPGAEVGKAAVVRSRPLEATSWRHNGVRRGGR